MRDRSLIAAGLLCFLGLATFPAWYGARSAKIRIAPDLKLPAGEKECVAPLSYMRSEHMRLLSAWRDRAVRQGVRTFEAANGRLYDISLSKTCLKQCHIEKSEFCDRCHAYNGVRNPRCWDCHVDPQQGNVAARPASDVREGERDGPR